MALERTKNDERANVSDSAIACERAIAIEGTILRERTDVEE
jgi:hypothetical protein